MVDMSSGDIFVCTRKHWSNTFLKVAIKIRANTNISETNMIAKEKVSLQIWLFQMFIVKFLPF